MLSYINNRNRDFIRVVDKLMAENVPGETVRQVVARAVLHKAPSYYVSIDTAEEVVKGCLCGMKPRCTPLKAQMWDEIAAKVRAVRDRNPHLAFTQVMARVLTSENASRFFIGAERGMTIYYEMRRLRQLTDSGTDVYHAIRHAV